jgi:ParB family chromosome partitioning protein
VVLNTPSRKERAAAIADGLFAPLAKRELLAGLGEVVNKKVPLTSIERNPRQPRQSVDETSAEFQDLVGSIRQQGLIQPISLWQLDEDEDRYVVIAGERRWRAFKRLAEENPADYSRIPATVTVLDGEQPEARALMMGLIENVVREDLKDGERADALARLKGSTGWTYEQIAQRMGMGVSRVVALASIARHEVVREAIDEGSLTQKQAILIGQGVRDPELAAELVAAAQGLDERQTRAVVQFARAASAEVSAAERVRVAAEQVALGVVVPDVSVPPDQSSSLPRRRGSPTPLTPPFVWRATATGQMEGMYNARGLQLTSVLAKGRGHAWELRDALVDAVIAFRDSCARTPGTSDEWEALRSALSEAVEGERFDGSRGRG